jgi:phosphoenolpyruvate-protein kinase (PTS system EI component)
MKSETFAVRSADYRDVSLRLLNALAGNRNTLQHKLNADHILLLTKLLPSLVGKIAQAGI